MLFHRICYIPHHLSLMTWRFLFTIEIVYLGVANFLCYCRVFSTSFRLNQLNQFIKVHISCIFLSLFCAKKIVRVYRKKKELIDITRTYGEYQQNAGHIVYAKSFLHEMFVILSIILRDTGYLK